MDEIAKKLQAPFPQEQIDFRVQSCGISNNRPWAMVLAYVQARAIQRRLDDVFGWDGWTEEYRSQDGNMICRLGVRLNDGSWIYKENGASETQVEAFKGGISGALKRAAASGYGIGRYLYDLTESFAQCTTEKPKNMSGWNKAKTKDNKTIYWKTPALPDWALPGGYEKPQAPTLDEVLKEWKALGGNDEEFDNWIKKQWNISRDQLEPHQLLGLQKVINGRKQKEGKAS